MRWARALEDKKFDVRLRDKFVADKKLENEQVEDYLKNLEDDTSKLTTTAESEPQA